MKAPIRTKGEEQQIHSSNKAIIVEKGTAADECSAQRNRSIIKNVKKTMLGKNIAVNKAFFNHFSPFVKEFTLLQTFYSI